MVYQLASHKYNTIILVPPPVDVVAFVGAHDSEIIVITLFYSNRSSYRLWNKFTNQDIECVSYQNKCSNQSLEQVHKTMKTYVTNNHQKIPKCQSRDKSTSSSVSKQYSINNAYYIIHTYKRL
jgi:hypothetical protein